jgi:hypothetical protein
LLQEAAGHPSQPGSVLVFTNSTMVIMAMSMGINGLAPW